MYGFQQCFVRREDEHFQAKPVVCLRVVAGVVERSKGRNQHPPPPFYDSQAVVVVEVIFGQPTELIANANQPVSGSELCQSQRRSLAEVALKFGEFVSLPVVRSQRYISRFREPLPLTNPDHFPLDFAQFLEGPLV